MQVLPLGQLVEMLLATGASLIQPTLRHPAGPRAQLHDLNSSCVAVQIRVASIDSPIFRVEAWTLFYQVLLPGTAVQVFTTVQKYVGRGDIAGDTLLHIH